LITLKRIFKISHISNNILTSILSLFLIIFYVYQDFTKWQIIKFIKAQGPILYVDSNTVLYYSSCFSRIGYKVFAAGTECANWTYGAGILRFLNLIGITQSNTVLVGHFFTYSIILTFVYFLYLSRNFRFAQITMFMGLISPSVWLLMERANFDALVYLMIFLVSVLFAKGFEIMPTIIVFLSATFKFYTLPLLLIPIQLSKKIHTKFLGILALFFGLIIIFNDYTLMNGKIVQAGNNHFGMKIIGNYLGKIGIKLNIASAYVLGAILIFACILVIVSLLSKVEPLFLHNELFPVQIKTFYIFMSSTFLLCFVVGLSVDYRLIFYLVSAPFLITLITSRLKFIISGVFLFGAWLCYPSGFFQTFGDFALDLIASLQIIVLTLFFGRGKDILVNTNRNLSNLSNSIIGKLKSWVRSKFLLFQ